jgi:hypothetical protein
MSYQSYPSRFLNPDSLGINGVDLTATGNTNYDSIVIDSSPYRAANLEVRVTNAGAMTAGSINLLILPQDDDGNTLDTATGGLLASAASVVKVGGTLFAQYSLGEGPLEAVGDLGDETAGWDNVNLPRKFIVRLQIQVSADAATSSLGYVGLYMRR